MSDSFADLWATSAPSSTASAAQKTLKNQPLASQATVKSPQPTQSNGGGRKYDAFSVLANSGTSKPSSRTATPQGAVNATQTSKGLNAFDDLVSLGSSSKVSKKNSPLSSQLSSNINSLNSSRERIGLNPDGITPPPVSTNNPDLWDFDLLSAPKPTQTASTSHSHSHSHSPSPDPFDFESLSNSGATPAVSVTQDDDDLLGDLSKPVSEVVAQRSTSSPRPQPSPQPRPPSTSSTATKTPRSGSPPPHIIGRIVEMGFTPQQARIALASTDTGLDVEQALETLLNNTEQTPDVVEARDLDRSPPRRSTQPPSRPRRTTDSPHQAPLESQEAGYQEQADKLIAQATQLGKGMFNRANAFWKEGRERVQKAYDEHQSQQSPASSTEARRNGRPKWMSDDQEGFKDDNEIAPIPRRERERQPRERSERTERIVPETRQPIPRDGERSSPKPARVLYQSPLRRGKPSPSPAAVSQPTPPRAPSPPKPHRYVSITASFARLSEAGLHKTKGNDAFKLGNYIDAEEAFNRAITSLPANHLLLVPLHTNRALTRLRNGNPKGCVEDSSSALEIINDDPRQGEVFPIPNQDPVKLDDAFVKALRRRAEGYEALEKWESARSDWERLAGANWAPSNQRSESSKGIGRCRKMLQPQPPTSSSSSAPPAPSRSRAPLPRPSRPQSDLALLTAEPSEKVARLREANSVLESEDNQRHVLKDSVDAKLAAWSAGKEANLRVLLANLDTILWEDLRWKKIGMAELVTESQVKINYTKAIAKVHPDKLANKNVTLEHKMIANGVFSILNKAWVSFKP